MLIEGKIISPTQQKCDKCKKFFKRGEEVKISIDGKDVLGWAGKYIKHTDCAK